MIHLAIQLDSDWHEVDEDLDRLERLPGRRGFRQLDDALELTATVVREDVHVNTASLLESVKTSSDVDRAAGRWSGEIEVGGASTGINNPVDYAIYEKQRGGGHDFMAEAEVVSPVLMELAIASILEGRRG